MGTIACVIEPLGPYHEIVEVGGFVNYSLEMRAWLARLPREQADRIVADLEYQHRRRRIIRLRSDAPRWLYGSPEMDRLLQNNGTTT